MKKWDLARRSFALAVAALAALGALAVAVPADQHENKALKSALFGSARLVIGGIAPHEIVPDLTSNCGAQPYLITCYSNTPPFTSSGVAFFPNPGLTVANLTTLSTDYNLGGSNCGGGSPRFVIFASNGDFFFRLLWTATEFYPLLLRLAEYRQLDHRHSGSVGVQE
jgi:hypothetical protein